jgi:hypothetical protein
MHALMMNCNAAPCRLDEEVADAAEAAMRETQQPATPPQ